VALFSLLTEENRSKRVQDLAHKSLGTSASADRRLLPDAAGQLLLLPSYLLFSQLTEFLYTSRRRFLGHLYLGRHSRPAYLGLGFEIRLDFLLTAALLTLPSSSEHSGSVMTVSLLRSLLFLERDFDLQPVTIRSQILVSSSISSKPISETSWTCCNIATSCSPEAFFDSSTLFFFRVCSREAA